MRTYVRLEKAVVFYEGGLAVSFPVGSSLAPNRDLCQKPIDPVEASRPSRHPSNLVVQRTLTGAGAQESLAAAAWVRAVRRPTAS
jgi:hypothetical protein